MKRTLTLATTRVLFATTRALITGLLLCTMAFTAVAADMKFRRLDARDGLSNTQVNSIFRDSRGYVWIATPYGLNRYDGYRIHTYYSQANDTTTLLRNSIDDVQQDGMGRLWLRHGPLYSLFDPVSETCNRHPERWLHEQGVKGAIERLYIDRRKNFWVKTYDEGMFFLNPRTRQVHRFTFGPGSQQVGTDFGVSDFAEHGNSLLMISNNGDIVSFHTLQPRISWKSSRLQRQGAPRNAAYTLHVDVQQNIWTLTDGGAYVFLRQEGRWVHSSVEVLHRLGIADTPRELLVWDAVTDRHGQLWLATDHEGLCVVDFKNHRLQQYKSIKNDETTISDNTLRCIYRDQLDRMWIATYMNGVSYYSDSQFNFRHVNLGNVNTVCVDHQGIYWAGSNDHGILRYNPFTGECTVFDKANSQLGSDIIVSSLAATDGTLWFGTYEGGLIHYQQGRFTTYRATGDPNGLVTNSVWAISEDADGNVWIGTLGGGLQRIDQQTGRFITLRQENSKLPSNYISSIQLLPDGRLLVGHTEFYSLVNPKTMSVDNYRFEEQHSDITFTPASNVVYQDSRNLVWQGAPSGATVCDPKTARCYLLDAKSGLVGSTVYGIVEDDHHVVWVVTQHGVSSVVPQSQPDGSWHFLVRSYNNRDGLQDGPFNQRSVILAPDGHIVVGGHEGLDIINPQKLRSHRPVAERPLLSGLRVMDRRVNAQTDRLSLTASDNQFTIFLSTNSGEVHNRTRFAYRLLGLSDQWRYTDDAAPDITYMGLAPGRYTFCARLLATDGTMGTDEVRLAVSVSAPWYRSWWMNIFYLALTVLLFYWFYRRAKDKLRLERLKLEQENSHRLGELRQKFAESINADLRQPFQNVFESLNEIMERETDEQRYEKQQQVFSHVEELLDAVSKLGAVGQEHSRLNPEVRELEIVSLDEKLVKGATDYVEGNLDNADITVETMAEALGMSRVHLYKRLTAITGMSPSEFIRQIRLRHAEQLLSRSQLTVAEVAYKVGFNNPRYLSKYFKEQYGVMPSEYKGKLNNTKQ